MCINLASNTFTVVITFLCAQFLALIMVMLQVDVCHKILRFFTMHLCLIVGLWLSCVTDGETWFQNK